MYHQQGNRPLLAAPAVTCIPTCSCSHYSAHGLLSRLLAGTVLTSHCRRRSVDQHTPMSGGPAGNAPWARVSHGRSAIITKVDTTVPCPMVGTSSCGVATRAPAEVVAWHKRPNWAHLLHNIEVFKRFLERSSTKRLLSTQASDPSALLQPPHHGWWLLLRYVCIA